MTKRDSILFDLDGTLWDAVRNITYIWNEGVKGHPAAVTLTEEKVRAIMGLTTKEIGQTLFPKSSEKEQEELMICCGAAEQRLLPHTGGILYPHLEETLKELKQSVPLFIVSNCDQGYIEAFLSYHQLTDYFTDHLCYGDTGRAKAENIRAIVKKHRLRAPVYVGDTEKDFLSAREAGVEFIHAAYGFGRIRETVTAIREIRELPQRISG